MFTFSCLFYFSHKSHSEASDTETAQSKHVGNENLDYLHGQLFVYFKLFVYFSQKSHSEASDTETAQSKDVGNENLDLFTWSAVCLPLAVCLLFSKKTLTGF